MYFCRSIWKDFQEGVIRSFFFKKELPHCGLVENLLKRLPDHGIFKNTSNELPDREFFKGIFNNILTELPNRVTRKSFMKLTLQKISGQSSWTCTFEEYLERVVRSCTLGNGKSSILASRLFKNIFQVLKFGDWLRFLKRLIVYSVTIFLRSYRISGVFGMIYNI